MTPGNTYELLMVVEALVAMVAFRLGHKGLGWGATLMGVTNYLSFVGLLIERIVK